jgi:hypothetical protein
MCGRFVRKEEEGGADTELQRPPGSLVPREEGATYPLSQVGYYACRVLIKVHKLTHGIMYKKSPPYMTIKDQGTQTSKWVNGTYRLERFVF